MINKIIQQNYQTWQKLQNFTQLPKNTYMLKYLQNNPGDYIKDEAKMILLLHRLHYLCKHEQQISPFFILFFWVFVQYSCPNFDLHPHQFQYTNKPMYPICSAPTVRITAINLLSTLTIPPLIDTTADSYHSWHPACKYIYFILENLWECKLKE